MTTTLTPDQQALFESIRQCAIARVGGYPVRVDARTAQDGTVEVHLLPEPESKGYFRKLHLYSGARRVPFAAIQIGD